MKAVEFDNKFDAGEDVTEFLDFATNKSINKLKPIVINIPFWMEEGLVKESERIGVDLQSVIKFWISEKLKMN
jgi:hypothetical protein